MTKIKPRHVQTPKAAAYPLSAKEVRVEPGEQVAQGQGLYVFTTADGRNILIKSPWKAKVGGHILPVGAVIERPMPFITLHVLPETSPPQAASDETINATAPPRDDRAGSSARVPHPERSAAGDGHARTSRSEPRQGGSGRQGNAPLPGKWKAAVITFCVPVCLLLLVLLLCDVAFPHFFEDHIVARWGLVLLAYLGGTWVATGYAQRIQPQKNLPTVAATGLVMAMVGVSFLPLEMTSEFVGDLQLGDLFKTKAYGVVLEDLENYSNGVTPVPTPQQARDFANWIND